jgi:Putative DNA-binding domain
MNLADLQRTMAAAVMQPLTRGEGMRSRTADGRSTAAVAGSFIAPNSRLTAFERLEIYNRQYWFRVLGALQEDFPAVHAVVGPRRFEAISVAYLTAHPSRSFTLRNLGSHLPEWLLAHPEQAGRSHRLAVDVARIEWAFVEAFDSAEREPLTSGQIAVIDGESRLALQPHLQLLSLSFPADNLVLDLHKQQKRQTSEAGVEREEEQQRPVKLPQVRPRSTWLAAHRIDLGVYYRRLEREEFQMLAAIRRGISLSQAIEAGFIDSRIPPKRQASKVQEWFGTWAELGWICAPELESLIKA